MILGPGIIRCSLQVYWSLTTAFYYLMRVTPSHHLTRYLHRPHAHKCLYVIRCLSKEGYQQPDVDYVFRSIVLPKLTYGLPVYPSSIPELTTVQNFLQRCFKRRYISYQIDIYNVLEEVDRSLFRISSMPGHPLHPPVPKTKESSARLRVPSSRLRKVNTQPFKNSFFNRLFFKYRVAI